MIVEAEALVAEMIEEMAAAVSAEVDLVEDAEMIVEVSVVAIAEAVVMAAVATLIPALTEVDAVAIATRKCTVKTSHRHKVAEAHRLGLGHAK